MLRSFQSPSVVIIDESRLLPRSQSDWDDETDTTTREALDLKGHRILQDTRSSPQLLVSRVPERE